MSPRSPGAKGSLRRLAEQFGRPAFALALFCLSLLAALWAGVFWVLETQRHAETVAAQRQLDNLALAFEEHTAETLKQANRLAVAVTRTAEQHGLNPEAFAALGPTGHAAVLQLSVIDAGGELAWSSLPYTRISLADREHFQVHLGADTGRPFVSKPVLGRTSGRWSVQVTRRINARDGHFGGVAVVSVDPLYFWGIYRRVDLGTQGVIMLVGRDGVVRTGRMGDGKRIIGADLTGSPLYALVRARDHVSTEEVGTDGARHLWSARTVMDHPSLSVVVGTGTDDVLANYRARQAAYLIAAGAASAALLAFCAALVLVLQRMQRTAARLRESEDRFRHAVDGSQAGIWDWDLGAGRYHVSPRLRALAGSRDGELPDVRESLRECMHPDDRAGFDRALEAHFRDRAPFHLELRLLRPDGEVVWVRAAGQAVWGPEGEVERFSGSVHDITDRKAAESRILALLAEERAIFEASRVGIAVLRDRQIMHCNPRFAEIFGRAREELIGSSTASFYPSLEAYHERRGDDAALERGEMIARDTELRHKDGHLVWTHGRLAAIQQGDLATGVVWVVEDITAQKAAQERLAQLAHFDDLTGLANRALFRDRLERAVTLIPRSGALVGLLFIDLDRLKVVNDTLGHEAGDALLKEAARRFTTVTRRSDTVARLGGDEFALVLPDLRKADAARVVAEKLLAALAPPFAVAGEALHVTASIGIAVAPADGADADALIRNADAAMYRAKDEGRNAFRFFAPEMNARALRALTLENELRRAIERNEFVLHYQPKVSLASGRITGVEALLRWRKDGMLVPPMEFIPLLEETGLIVPVGAWVIEEALRQAAEWARHGAAGLRVAVNVSARQLQRGDLAETVERALAKSGVPGGVFEVELTENSVMQDAKRAAATFARLEASGVRVAIDDFGTGYSSLGYLKSFAVDALKIDRSFVKDLPDDANDAAITVAIVALAHSLGIAVVAEGVETEAQRRFLAGLGCDEYQGYLCSPPLPAERVLPLLVPPRVAVSNAA